MRLRSLIVPALIPAVVIALFVVVDRAGQAATAPPADPGALIENVPPATSVYGLHDTAGHTMDTVKVVVDPTTAGRYLAVYHWVVSGGYNVGVATSTDLRTWTYRRTLDTSGSQPYLAFSPVKNGPVLADESFSSPHLRFQYWTSVRSMLGTAAPYKTFDAPRTLSSCAEGTPDIRSVSYTSSSSTITSGSTIVVGHHYFSNCQTDREAVGTLTNFGKWTTAAAPAADQRLSAAGAVGKHGDRDDFMFGGKTYTLYEGGDTVASAMGDWRNYLDNGTSARQLTIHTKGGSTAFANPSVTVLPDPAGVPSLLVTEFLPSEGAASGESGELIYWQPLGSSPSPTPTATTPTATSPTPTSTSPTATSTSPTATSTSPTATSTPPTSSSSTTTTPTPTTTPPVPGKVTKILTFIEENHSLAQMESGMPYLYTQAQEYGYATNWTAIRHPSLPNYLALAGGSTFGVADDSPPSSHPISGPNVFGAAISAGHTAKAYAESMPSNCALSTSGPYAVKHNPWPYFTADRANCAKFDVPSGTITSGALHTDLTAGTLPTIGEVTPNLNNDAHDGTLSTADTWLKGWLTLVYASPDWKSGHLAVVITADEDNNTSANKVLTTVIHPSLSHVVVSTALTHYSWTQMMTNLSGAPCINGGCTAANAATAFGLSLQ